MLLAALLLAQPALQSCPAHDIAFAPPVDRPLILERRIERELHDGQFLQRIRYRLRFAPAGRGYRLEIEQIALTSDGPPALLRLLALQEESTEGETLDMTLDAHGAILGISESPDAAQRLAAALARLRADPAVAARPAVERAQIEAMLGRIAALGPDERAAVHRAKFGRLLMFAGRGCADATVTSHDGAPYRLVKTDGESWELAAASDSANPDASTASVSDRATVSPATGLVMQFERQTVTRVGGTERRVLESLALSADLDGMKP